MKRFGVDNNYWLMRITDGMKEGKSDERARYYDASDDGTGGYLSVGWGDLKDLSDPKAVLEKQSWMNAVLGSGNRSSIKNLLHIQKGDIILVPWLDWTQFCLFKATSPWMNYHEVMKHSAKVRELEKEWDLLNCNCGFFIKAESISDMIPSGNTPFKAVNGHESIIGSKRRATIYDFNKYKDMIDQVIASLPLS